MDVITLCTVGACVSVAVLVKLLSGESVGIQEYDVRRLVIRLKRESELPPHKKYSK